MKRLSLLLPLLLWPGPATHAAGPPAASLPYARCVHLDSINEWYVVGVRTVLVRTGPYRYRITTRADCPRLGVGVPGMRLHPSESDKAIGEGRLCGGVGETVSAAYQPRCAIAAVELIDKPSFERERKQSSHRGSGADQPTAVPGGRH